MASSNPPSEGMLEWLSRLEGKPYGSWKEGDNINNSDGPFWTKAEKVPDISNIDSVSCAGLINLGRRFMRFDVPGIESNYQGGTYIWFQYLSNLNVLHDVDINKKYPNGTLLLRNYNDVDNQGHVAIVYTANDKLKDSTIIHSYTDKGVSINSFMESHKWIENGYFTHVCLPENWANHNFHTNQ